MILTITFQFSDLFFWQNFIISVLPEIFINCNIMLILIILSLSYFGFERINKFKYKLFSIKLLQLNIELLYVIVALLLWHIFSQNYFLVNKYISCDFYSTLFKIIIVLTTIFILQNSKNFITFHLKATIEYTFLIHLITFFLMLLVSAISLIFMFACILGFSLGLYILVMFDTPYKKSLEASIKYFYLSALSSGLIASGLFFTYFWLGGLEFWYIITIINSKINLANFTLSVIALCSIAFGILFKLGAFPCHLWAPEIYEGSPNPIMAFFILPIKIGTLGIFLKLLTVYFIDAFNAWNYILWFSAIASMIWGCLGAVTEDSLKKFVAYSSINQIGLLLMGIVCGTFGGTRAIITYLFIYIIMNISFIQLYLNSLNILTKTNIEYITDLKYYAINNWKYSIGFVIILFSMAGIPPLAGFFGKYFLFITAFSSQYYALVVTGMLTSLISTFYYLRFIKILWFEESFLSLINANSFSLITKLTIGETILYFISLLFLVVFITMNKHIYYLTTLMVIF